MVLVICEGMVCKNTIILLITGPLWGESTGNQWIPLTKGQ